MKKNITPEIWQYCMQYGNPKPAQILELIIEQNKLLPNGHMQTGVDQAFFMGFFAKTIQANSYLEIGIFTGYSLINMATYLPQTAKITALELEDKHIRIVQDNIQVANKIHAHDNTQPIITQNIEYIVGDANITLPQLIQDTRKYDLIFIDANKSTYLDYYTYAKQLLAPHGVLLIDNVFKGFNDINQEKLPKFAEKVHEMNLAILNDQEVESCMLPISDGLTMVRLKHV